MSAIDEYICPEVGCDYITGAVGPLDPEEPDYFAEEVEEHRRGHAAEREQDVDDLDEPVPYVPVSPRSVRHTHEPCDLTPQFSSQAGVAAHRYSPTRFGALIPSGGVRMHPKPASSDDTKPARTFGYNIVTVHPDGRHGGPRLTNAVTREEALAELDELAPFMVDGYTTVLVELREVAR